jgi:hypothetical protein
MEKALSWYLKRFVNLIIFIFAVWTWQAMTFQPTTSHIWIFQIPTSILASKLITDKIFDMFGYGDV